MALLDDIKQTLRISNIAMDLEVTDLIESAKLDLKISGINYDKKIVVNSVEEVDPLIKRAITTYCKAYFGYDNSDADRFKESYEMLKIHLALSSEYQLAVV